MSTPVSGFELDSVQGLTFTLDLELDSDLSVLSLTIEEIHWFYNKQGHRVECPAGVNLKVLKAELKDELNKFHREKIAEAHHDRMEALAERID